MFTVNIDRRLESLSEELFIYTPIGDVLVASKVYRNCMVQVDGVAMTVVLIPLDL